MAEPAAQGSLRKTAYTLLIVVALASLLARIAAVNSVDRLALETHLQRSGRDDWRQQRPFLSANDRSRWCTIRALVEHGTYAIDEVIQEPLWDTIDMVKHDGHLYSSKPPLLPTLLAGPYWLIHRLTGWTLGDHPFEIGRALLILSCALPWGMFLVLVAIWAERYGQSDFGRLLVVATACFGTLLTTFAVTLTNHLFAAVSVAISVHCLLRLVEKGPRAGTCFLAGLSGAFAAACELPALAWLAGLAVWIALLDRRQALGAFLPAVLLVAAAFFGTNWAAHGTWRPAYSQRSEGENWYDYTYEVRGRTRESYWRHRVGIDRGESSPARYALHALVGHHGVFSLTPLWFATWLGWYWAARGPDRNQARLALLAAAVSTVCLAFYLARPLIDRNYGGLTAGFRWQFWLIPLWLLGMLPAADRLGAWRWGRGLMWAALAVSVFSVAYPTWNPWTHPWAWNLGQYLSGPAAGTGP